MRAIGLVSLVVLAAACAPAAGWAVKVYPVDQAGRDPSFAAFRRQLLHAAYEYDSRFVVAHLSPGIKTSFGSTGGIADFRQRWQPDRRDSDLWPVLIDVLTHGGSFGPPGQRAQFWAPYWFSTWPENQDPFFKAVIIGRQVPLRSVPRHSAPVSGRLTYDIVAVKTFQPVTEKAGSRSYRWLAVTTADGRKGYVPAGEARNPIGWRAGFANVGGRWLMEALIAGD